ncbi:MAG: outer membrane beta-barrel protein [Verrucomicrobiota bacterium]
MKLRIKTPTLALHASAVLLAALPQVYADSAKEAIKTPTPEPRFKLYGWLEGGMTVNPAGPADNQNFGRLFDDRSNEPLLNQFSLTAERTLDSAATGFDWGFKTQVMFGSDSRFTHSVGILDHVSNDRYQPDLVEAYLNLHCPVLSDGGVDFKIGKVVSLEGAETVDPRTNVFYSHSYIFNFAIPLTYTGVQADWHVTKTLDIYAGITRGVNTSIEDNNDSVAFQGGFGLNLLDGKFTLLAITHLGPETPNDNHDYRYLNAITATWKISDKFTSITDINSTYDEAASASCYGVAQYFTYQINDWLTAGVRAEVWRDDKGFYAVQFANNTDPMHLLRGDAGYVYDPRTVGGGKTTYGAITLGANIKVPVPKPAEGLVIRPEVRLDTALNGGSRPFNDSTDRSMLTLGLDAILTF